MSGWCDAMPDRDALEERAAIIAEGERCTRWLAQETAARQHGFESWSDAMRSINTEEAKETEDA